VVLCDVGANVSCRPQHLYQYGIMAAIYSKALCNVANPRVGLLSVGEEEGKGTTSSSETHELFKNDTRINFVGNAEGRDIFRGGCDVVACEGLRRQRRAEADGGQWPRRSSGPSLPEAAAVAPCRRRRGQAGGQEPGPQVGLQRVPAARRLLGVDGICHHLPWRQRLAPASRSASGPPDIRELPRVNEHITADAQPQRGSGHMTKPAPRRNPRDWELPSRRR